MLCHHCWNTVESCICEPRTVVTVDAAAIIAEAERLCRQAADEE